MGCFLVLNEKYKVKKICIIWCHHLISCICTEHTWQDAHFSDCPFVLSEYFSGMHSLTVQKYFKRVIHVHTKVVRRWRNGEQFKCRKSRKEKSLQNFYHLDLTTVNPFLLKQTFPPVNQHNLSAGQYVSKTLKMCIPFDLLILLLEMHCKEIVKLVPKDACTKLYIKMLVMMWRERKKTLSALQ